MKINNVEYVVGQDRNEDNSVAHLYRGDFHEPGDPMCVRGWNRSNGQGYSIFRNNWTNKICKTCLKRAEQNKPPIPSRPRKTKWI